MGTSNFLGINTGTEAEAAGLLKPGGIAFVPVYLTDSGKLALFDGVTAGGKRVAWSTDLPPPIRGQLSGLTTSNNVGTPNTKVDIAPGQATDSSSLLSMISAGTLTVNFATTGANALDTGAIASNTGYFIFLIGKPDGTVAGLASTSLAPALPAGYSFYRRVGWVKTDGSSHILAFVQIDKDFYWGTLVRDFNGTNTTASRTLYALTVPIGVNVRAKLIIGASVTAGNGRVTSPLEADTAVTAAGSGLDFSGTTSFFSGDRVTDTSAQIGVRGTAAGTINIFTRGWTDPLAA